MRLSLPLRYIAPPPIPPRPTIPQIYSYLSQKMDLPVRLDEQVESVSFIIRNFADGHTVKRSKENRFFSPRRIDLPPHRAFPLHQLVYQNPDVHFEFSERVSEHPDRALLENQTEEEALLQAAARGLKPQALEEQRKEEEALVNQEEFVDVSFVDNPTPLRLNISDLTPTSIISLLTSLVPPQPSSTSSTTSSSSSPQPPIPLGQGPELWKHVWETRNLASDKTRYLWRGGKRVRVKTREELIKEGLKVRSAGLPESKRKWFQGKLIFGEQGREGSEVEEGEGGETTATA